MKTYLTLLGACLFAGPYLLTSGCTHHHHHDDVGAEIVVRDDRGWDHHGWYDRGGDWHGYYFDDRHVRHDDERAWGRDHDHDFNRRERRDDHDRDHDHDRDDHDHR